MPDLDRSSAPLIDGAFTQDALPDLTRYLCSRGESLFFELSSLAGVFQITVHAGVPVDAFFIPVRPTGAHAGMRALRTLFRQQGGRFTVTLDSPSPLRLPSLRPLSLSGSCENLLALVATLDDERDAPGVRRVPALRMVSDLETDLRLVSDLPSADHRTAFQAFSGGVPLLDVLQLFSVNRDPFCISVSDLPDRVAGTLLLKAGVVGDVYCGKLSGQEAFTALLDIRREVRIDVRPARQQGLPPVMLGPLDQLLMKELLSGRFGGGNSPAEVQQGEVQEDEVQEDEAASQETPAVTQEKAVVSPARFWRWRFRFP